MNKPTKKDITLLRKAFFDYEQAYRSFKDKYKCSDNYIKGIIKNPTETE